MAAAAPAVAGTTPVQAKLDERKALAERHAELRIFRKEHVLKLRREIRQAQRVIETPGAPRDERAAHVRETANDRWKDAKRRMRKLDGWTEQRLATLDAGRAATDTWLDTYGIFRVCPVPYYTDIANNFGIMVRIPHVPPHRHMGNDIAAPLGSPILSPFDGYATTTWNSMGGNIVHVEGEFGSTYHAHLSSYGALGPVEAGDVIGYVGTTGDALGPHDHFEWHPWNGPAVDPYALLVAACVAT
jgi:murein DD-endopeptidase MepM/ murein hydrolase activator NlpD